MWKDFDLTVSPTGGLNIGKYTYQRYLYAIRSYWNGDYESAIHIRTARRGGDCPHGRQPPPKPRLATPWEEESRRLKPTYGVIDI